MLTLTLALIISLFTIPMEMPDIDISDHPVNTVHSTSIPANLTALIPFTNVDIFALDIENLADIGWCGTGGVGTKACEISFFPMHCAALCDDGYHACCSFIWGCRCRKNKDVIDEGPTENETEIPIYALKG